MIKVINSNLLRASQKVIVHQVNCKSVMANGVAKQLRIAYPKIYTSYMNFIGKTKKVSLLGKINVVECSEDKVIINMFSQFDYGRDTSKVYTNYSAMKLAFKSVRAYLLANGIKELAMPYGIGCGLANGEWVIVSSLIEEIFEDFIVYLYKI